jgi:dihydrofolate synthase/folylpolyglutamate synthase
MTYAAAVRFLYTLGNEVKGAKLGLERIGRLLEALGRPHDHFHSVHIAGTNGKGSTAAMIESGLRAAGRRTGLYTSPHLLRLNERVQVAGEPVSDEDFAAGWETVRAAVERLLAAGLLDSHPTFFECVTALAFQQFAAAGVEWAVVEVGLGGRLDATNVVRPELAVITPIDFDHEAFLGKAASAISAEKAGILKSGVPAVFSPQRPEAREVLEARALELDIPVVRVEAEWRAEDVTHTEGRYRFTASHCSGLRFPLLLGLAGEHQVTNALTAVAALHRLGVAPENIASGVEQARWPGRLETAGRDPLVLLDGAHNPAGARALARYLEEHLSRRRIWLVYAAMRDKAVDEVAGLLFPLAHEVLLTRVAQSRALGAETLAEIAGHHHPRVRITAGLAEALAADRGAASPEDVILITGSLFLVAEAKVLLGNS